MPLQDASSCHHCHIHSPIPSEDLKRTHPLRSSQINKPHDSISSRSHDIARGFKKNVSFLYGKIQKRDARSAAKETQGNGSIPSPPPPPPPLPQHIRTVDLPPVVVVEKPVSRATITTVQTPVLGALTLSPGRCVPITSTALPPSPASSTPPPIPPPLRDARSRRKGGVGMAGVQTAVLIGAYALLVSPRWDRAVVESPFILSVPLSFFISRVSNDVFPLSAVSARRCDRRRHQPAVAPEARPRAATRRLPHSRRFSRPSW